MVSSENGNLKELQHNLRYHIFKSDTTDFAYLFM